MKTIAVMNQKGGTGKTTSAPRRASCSRSSARSPERSSTIAIRMRRPLLHVPVLS